MLRKILHMWLALGILSLGLTDARSLSAGERQASATKNKATANLPAAPSESSSRPAKKDKEKASDRVVPQSTSSASTASQPPTVIIDQATYRIGIEDELQISVWREPELSLAVVVRPDGVITMPLLNDVRVVGLSPMELQTLLGEKLKEFVTEPQVTVIVRQIRSRRVYLVGDVGRQGAFPLNGSRTVLELLAEAGGLGPFAKAGSVYILRNQNGRQIRIPFNYKKAIAGRVSKENPVLEPGDVVVVP